MAMNALSEEELLECLHLRDTGTLNTTQIAERFTRSRGSIIGALNRVDKSIDKYDPDGNQNGSMKPRWWKR